MPLINDARAVRLGTVPAKAVHLGAVKVWPVGRILGSEQGTGSMTTGVDFAFPVTLTGSDVYLFVYRNSTISTPTATNMTRVFTTDPGAGRTSIWRITGAGPKLRSSGATSAINWFAVSIGGGPHSGVEFVHTPGNTTPDVAAPVGGGAAPALVCYGVTGYAAWTPPAGGQVLHRDTHTEARPSNMLVYFPSGPPSNVDRGRSGTSLIENSAAIWWS